MILKVHPPLMVETSRSNFDLAPVRRIGATAQARRTPGSLAPGVMLCVAVACVALGLQALEREWVGRAWLESLVLAIVVGAGVRTLWTPGVAWRAGVDFSAKMLLEIAVVLLGASVSAQTLLAVGPAMLLGVAAVVSVAILASYGLGRLLRLPHRMATLVACGNSICGNSAIAAVAPVIGAEGKDVAAAIAFTAVLGVAVVLGLPLVGLGLHMSGLQFGALAGLTVYAVPQVLAATAPLGAAAVQVGTLVKLVRVLMLGPVCFVLSLLAGRAAQMEPSRTGLGCIAQLHKYVPWFIVGFLLMIAARSFDLIPHAAIGAISGMATLLTLVSMAALGLSSDMRVVAKAGGRVALAVTLSLLVLGVLSFGLIRLLHLA